MRISNQWVKLGQSSARGGQARGEALSALLGAGFTLGLFLAIAHFEAEGPEMMEADIMELRSVAMPGEELDFGTQSLDDVETLLPGGIERFLERRVSFPGESEGVGAVGYHLVSGK